MTTEPLPTWLTAEQVLEACPWLTARTLRTWSETGQVRFKKMGTAVNARRLYTLADIYAVIDRVPAVNDEMGAAR